MPNKSNQSALNSEKTHADKKVRRGELYKLKQSEKKENLLAQTRATSFTASSCSTDASSSHTTLPSVQCLAAISIPNGENSITGNTEETTTELAASLSLAAERKIVEADEFMRVDKYEGWIFHICMNISDFLYCGVSLGMLLSSSQEKCDL